jgi:Zn-finger nucleic acid-binding protein
MKCPVCKEATLTMAERQGVEIDYFPQCRGVWLDRGELDKFIEKSLADDVGGAPTGSRPVSRQTQPGGYSQQPRYDGGYYHRKKKWWHDMFDFD